MIYFHRLSIYPLVELKLKNTRKSLAQLDTPVNNQNNGMKLSGFTFRLDVTRSLHRGNFSTPKNYFAIFYDQPYILLPFSVL